MMSYFNKVHLTQGEVLVKLIDSASKDIGIYQVLNCREGILPIFKDDRFLAKKYQVRKHQTPVGEVLKIKEPLVLGVLK